MLKIKNLTVNMQDKMIIDDLDLEINPGEIHVIMGPNGSGKSTLAYALAGKPEYTTTGEVLFDGKDLIALPPHERALAGLFLAMQYPTEIPGVANSYFIKTALNAHLKHQNQEEVDSFDFLAIMKESIKKLPLPESLLHRAVNVGFSGGEKKSNEILQLLLLKPKLAILDETDSGLDIDSLKNVAQAINSLRSPQRSILLITHYQRLLNYVEPDFIHIMSKGKIVLSGDKSLVRKLEEEGYAKLIEKYTLRS